MASSYPGSLDSLATNRTGGQVIAASTDNDHSDAINKIEAELGTTPSGAAATVAARILATEANVGNRALNVKDAQFGPNGVIGTHGAIMDGTSRPLSDYFANLAAAQTVYPHAVALTDELDWAAWQFAINTAMGSGVASAVARYPEQEVYLPAGTLVINRPIDVLSNNGISIRGAGAGATRIRISASMTNVFNCNGTTSGTIGGFAFTGTQSTSSGTGITTLNSTSITSVAAMTGVANGNVITGTGIPSGTRIVSGAGTATLVISRPATANGAGVALTGYGYSCTNVLNVDWVVAQSARSSQNTTFYDIDIWGQMHFINGVAIGTVDGTQDIYNHRFIGVRVFGLQEFPINFTGNITNTSPVITNLSSINGLVVGQSVQGLGLPTATILSIDGPSQITISGNAFQTTTSAELGASGWSEGTLWQAAFKLGQGAQGNVITHTFLGCNGAQCISGISTAATGFHWVGGALQANQRDVYCSGAGAERVMLLDGVRSERSAALVDGTNGGKQDITLRNTTFVSPYIRSSRNVITWAFGGVCRLESVTFQGQRSTLKPRMQLGAPASDCAAIIDGISISATATTVAPSNWLTVSGTRLTYSVRQVLPIDNLGQPVAMSLLGPYSNRDRTATAVDLTATMYDSYIGVTSTAAARAITLPATSVLPDGHELTVKDESGGAGTNNITVSRAGSDTIEGGTSVVINANYGSTKLKKVTGTTWVVVP